MDGPSTSTIFAVSFLGALFAIVASLLLVYTYVMLRLIPKLKRSFLAFVKEIGPKALFERANLDPAEVMQEFGVSSAEDIEALKKQAIAQAQAAAGGMRVIFTCEDHGRCDGCAKVLAQFEAIIKHQGEDSFDEVEQKCYAQLKEQLAGTAHIEQEKAA